MVLGEICQMDLICIVAIMHILLNLEISEITIVSVLGTSIFLKCVWMDHVKSFTVLSAEKDIYAV